MVGHSCHCSLYACWRAGRAACYLPHMDLTGICRDNGRRPSGRWLQSCLAYGSIDPGVPVGHRYRGALFLGPFLQREACLRRFRPEPYGLSLLATIVQPDKVCSAEIQIDCASISMADDRAPAITFDGTRDGIRPVGKAV